MRNKPINPKDNKIVYFGGAKEETGMEKIRRFDRKKKFGRLYRILLSIVVVAALGLAYYIYVQTKIYSTYTVTASVKHETIETAFTKTFGDSILTYSKDGANAVDGSGNLLWNQTFDMQSPMIAKCDDTVAFADYGGNVIYVQKSSGEVGSVKTDMPIRKIATSSKGYVAAVLEDTSVTWIYLYDLNGTTIAYFRTTMEKSGYPIALDISPNGELVCVSYYYVDCEDVKSSVAFYNFGPVGQNNIDNYVSGYNYTNCLVPSVHFLNDETAIAVSNERISVYSGAHKPVSISEMIVNDEIVSVYTAKDAFAIIYRDSDHSSKYRLELYDNKGQKKSEKEFDFDYSNVSLGNGMVMLYGDTNLYIGTYSGAPKYEGQYEKPVVLVLPTTVSNRFVCVTQDTIDTVEFK